VNIHYASPGLPEFYSNHRSAWEDFYVSERTAFEASGLGPETSILDVGCACGGLGTALNERFGCTNYVGLEIHEGAAAIGALAVASFGGRVLSGDILEGSQILKFAGLPQEYDLVVSLSALDWNADVRDNILQAWRHVAIGGALLMSLRLHPNSCHLDLEESRQSTTPHNGGGDEFAPYVIMSVPAAVEFATRMGAASVRVFGHWGAPSATAQTPVDRCIFALAILTKTTVVDPEIQFLIDGPGELVEQVKSLNARRS
jgi:SAM-dependent methyltransferase